MRTISYIAVFLGGLIFCYLLVSLGVVDKVDGIPGTQKEPILSLPTYLSFLGVMLTSVTAVLAALAIGIGVVAAYTFKEIRNDAGKAVASKVEEVLSEEAINARILQYAKKTQTPTIAELEEGFDPNDDGNR